MIVIGIETVERYFAEHRGDKGSGRRARNTMSGSRSRNAQIGATPRT
jgi:hypothetical protein